MEFPTEIGHVEEIGEVIVEEQEEDIEMVLAPEVAPMTKQGGAQKVVLIQTPQGVTRAVRVQGTQPSTSSAGTVQYVKTEGGLIQVRNTPQPQVMHRVVAPATANVVLKGPSTNKSYVMAKPSHPQTVTKTITMAQAQQMGLLSHTGTTSAGRVITLNPTIKSEPLAATVVKGSKPKLASDSPRIIQITPGGGRAVVAQKVAPKQSTVQYIDVQQSPKEVTVKSESLLMVNRKSGGRQEEQKLKVSTQQADRLLQLEGSVVIPGHNQSKVVMLPQDYMDHLVVKEQEEDEQEQDEQQDDESHMVDDSDIIVQSMSPTPQDLFDVSGKKRPCNCTKSQCLKLYCECFANGEFCSDCNCKECFNTLEHEEERQAAIYSCLERNPNAFRPKIGKVSSAAAGLRHHKGCHCKRSGCLKNYCECFEAKIPCSEICKCVDCKNHDGHFGDQYYGSAKTVSAIKRAAAVDGELRVKSGEDDEPPPKQPFNFMTADVVDATVQCMMAQADECQQNGVSFRNTERLILEEFGRCLAEIIDFSTKNGDAE